MNDRANSSLAALGIVIVLLVLFMLLTGKAFPQVTACDHHTDSFERFENVRITPPALITEYKPEQIEYYVVSTQSKRSLVGYFHLDDRSDITDDFKADVKGRKWWLFYCIKCKYLYGAIRYGASKKK